MDDNTKKKQALKVDFSNDVDPDPEQEGEICDLLIWRTRG
jgi:hypothetical protein